MTLTKHRSVVEASEHPTAVSDGRRASALGGSHLVHRAGSRMKEPSWKCCR